MARSNISARRRLYALLSLLTASVCGCLAVRIVDETPVGGVVVMPNNSDQWPTYYRNRAQYLMKQKCPDGYVIVREEEFVDNPAARDGRKPYEHFEYSGGIQRISSYEQKAYRIAFRRGVAANEKPAPSKREKEKPSADELPPPRRLPDKE